MTERRMRKFRVPISAGLAGWAREQGFDVRTDTGDGRFPAVVLPSPDDWPDFRELMAAESARRLAEHDQRMRKMAAAIRLPEDGEPDQCG